MTTIVGFGGTTRAGSSTELALRVALKAAEEAGASVRLFDGEFLVRLPHYGTPASAQCTEARDFIQAMRIADGVIIASPGYHGSISGLVKNAIDYVEETAKDGRVYLDGVPVGLISTAYGWQATGSTLAALRSIVHALRAWPTPMGATIKASSDLFEGGQCTDQGAKAQLELVGRQVTNFARIRETTAA